MSSLYHVPWNVTLKGVTERGKRTTLEHLKGTNPSVAALTRPTSYENGRGLLFCDNNCWLYSLCVCQSFLILSVWICDVSMMFLIQNSSLVRFTCNKQSDCHSESCFTKQCYMYDVSIVETSPRRQSSRSRDLIFSYLCRKPVSELTSHLYISLHQIVDSNHSSVSKNFYYNGHLRTTTKLLSETWRAGPSWQWSQ